MDSDTLHLDLDYVSSSGVVLSVEQKSALQSSLAILKAQQRFQAVKFWGKILGVKNDYFIVQGFGSDELGGKRTFYSLDCIKWGLLQMPDAEIQRRCALIKGRFTGDPSQEFEYNERLPEPFDSEKEDENELNMMYVKEEDRLATVIAAIDVDVAVVPRGAYIRSAAGEVSRNRSFQGLGAHDALRLSSYFHFRDPLILPNKTLLQKASLDKAIDFLDPIDVDIPKGGSWSMQFERGKTLVVLRNLHWLGHTFYHRPGTQTFGSIYVGTGEKNLDLPFML